MTTYIKTYRTKTLGGNDGGTEEETEKQQRTHAYQTGNPGHLQAKPVSCTANYCLLIDTRRGNTGLANRKPVSHTDNQINDGFIPDQPEKEVNLPHAPIKLWLYTRKT